MSGVDPTDRGSRFRPDLEGLRAVAVVLVLLFHAGVPGISGGFVGVDVFFVLSGFLITGLIVRELRSTGTIDLPAFYARRARRLLPAAALTLAVTIIAAAVILPPLQVSSVAEDVAAAALYVSNLRFAVTATDYFQAAQAPSPVLHFWSLGVEEQFYLFWPALLLLAARLRFGSPRRLALVIAVVALVSLAGSIVVTAASPPLAFYLLPTRAWELGLGGLIALLDVMAVALPSLIALLAAGAGLAMVLAAGLFLDASVPFPGSAALLPTVGAGLVILAGLDGGRPRPLPGPSRLLTLGPMRWLGRISYSLYLWHWPVLVLGAAIAVTPLELPVRVALALASVGIAAISQRWVEEPIRQGRFVGRQPVRSLALVGSLGVVVALLSVSVGAAVGPPSGATASIDPGSQIANALGTPHPPPPSGKVPSGPPASAAPTPIPATPGGPVPADLEPSLAQAHQDTGVIYADGCEATTSVTVPKACIYGDRSSSTVVALIGDSHAAQWFPALDAVAQQRGWRLVVLTKTACPAVARTVWSGELQRAYTECDAFMAAALQQIAQLHPALVVVSRSKYAAFVVDGHAAAPDQTAALWTPAYATTLRAIVAAARHVVVIGDTPQMAMDPADCLSAHLGNVLACARPRAQAVASDILAEDQAAATAAGASFIDPTAWVCPSEPCPVVIGSLLLYLDAGHLDATFSAALAPYLGTALGIP
jgi:peptidoglycan/LPS O-acetylase OafA/YrhL